MTRSQFHPFLIVALGLLIPALVSCEPMERIIPTSMDKTRLTMKHIGPGGIVNQSEYTFAYQVDVRSSSALAVRNKKTNGWDILVSVEVHGGRGCDYNMAYQPLFGPSSNPSPKLRVQAVGNGMVFATKDIEFQFGLNDDFQRETVRLELGEEGQRVQTIELRWKISNTD